MKKHKHIRSILIGLIILLMASCANNSNSSNSNSVDASERLNLPHELDFYNLVFGKTYNLGYDISKLNIEVDVDDIFEFNDTSIRVIGIGKGNIEISTKGGIKLYKGPFETFDSALVSQIRDQLLSSNVISSHEDNITIENLDYVKNMNLDYVINDDSSILDGLMLLTNLEVLSLRSNNLSDISFLKKFKNLVELDVSDNKLTISTLENYLFSLEVDNKIKYFGMGANRNESVPDLSNLTNLETLDLGDSYFLKDISNITSNLNIKALYLNGCNNWSINDDNFKSTLELMVNLKRVSFVNGLSFINNTKYSYLVSKMENDKLFGIKIFNDEWITKDNINNYDHTIYFTKADFDKDCQSGVYKVTGSQNRIILQLNSFGTSSQTLTIPNNLLEIHLYGKKGTNFNHSFKVLERGTTEFTFNMYNYNTVGNGSNIIKATTNSTIIINNVGESKIDNSNYNSDAIDCYDIFIYSLLQSNKISVSGGKGVRGADGQSNDTSLSKRHGADGGTGYAGIRCHNASFIGFGISVRGGDGGNGGNGGKATGGFFDWNGDNGHKGGNGGNGGQGGTGVLYSGVLNYDSNTTLSGGSGGGYGTRGGGGYWGSSGSDGSRGRNGYSTSKIYI